MGETNILSSDYVAGQWGSLAGDVAWEAQRSLEAEGNYNERSINLRAAEAVGIRTGKMIFQTLEKMGIEIDPEVFKDALGHDSKVEEVSIDELEGDK